MSEQVLSEQTPANATEALRTKRAGRICIALFVVFLISLLSFGKAPLIWARGTDGSRINFDIFSCLGVAMGAVSLVFALTTFRRALRLSKARKVLGLIGCSGLIVHSLVALLFPLSYGASGTPPVGTGANPLFARSGPEEWSVDGTTYKIASTYYLRLPQGFQYTIEYPYHFGQSQGDMNDQRALAIAFPLMKHAYTKKLYGRASVTKIGEGPLTPSRIGVVLFERNAGAVRGYRAALSLDQIKERIARAASSGSTLPATQPAR